MLDNINHMGLLTNAEIMKVISTRVVKERKIKNMTQRELSQHSGVSLSTLRLFERTGQTSFENLIQLSRALGRVKIFLDLFDFFDEYKKLGYDEYNAIKKRADRKSIRSIGHH